jgi:hypothetical protein
MTPREAFGALAYTFHGKGPGKNKQARRLKRYKQEIMKRSTLGITVCPEDEGSSRFISLSLRSSL